MEYIFASEREVDTNPKDEEEPLIDIAKERGKEFQSRKEDYTRVVELLESFKRNPNETRFKLRLQLGFIGNI